MMFSLPLAKGMGKGKHKSDLVKGLKNIGNYAITKNFEKILCLNRYYKRILVLL